MRLHSNAPLIMLTAPGEEIDRVLEYLTAARSRLGLTQAQGWP